jgi:hypothetical protein
MHYPADGDPPHRPGAEGPLREPPPPPAAPPPDFDLD